eukprot:14455508-Alexandrium_andersonii.AAC.1
MVFFLRLASRVCSLSLALPSGMVFFRLALRVCALSSASLSGLIRSARSVVGFLSTRLLRLAGCLKVARRRLRMQAT